MGECGCGGGGGEEGGGEEGWEFHCVYGMEGGLRTMV